MAVASIQRKRTRKTKSTVTPSRLKIVCAVRHGEYFGPKGRLTKKGIKQSKELAAKLRTLIPKKYSIVLLYSCAPQAVYTAEIVSYSLNPFLRVTCGKFWVIDHHEGRKMKEEVEMYAKMCDAVVFIAHEYAPYGLANAVANSVGIPSRKTGKCEHANGTLVNLATHEVIPNIMTHEFT